MKRKFSTPCGADLYERIMKAYKRKERGLFYALYSWYYKELDSLAQKEIDDIMDIHKTLAPVRKAFADKDYYETKRLLDECKWMLPADKIQEIEHHLNNIYPSDLLQYAYKIGYVSKDTTKY